MIGNMMMMQAGKADKLFPTTTTTTHACQWHGA
jgi:hypothetical protein